MGLFTDHLVNEHTDIRLGLEHLKRLLAQPVASSNLHETRSFIEDFEFFVSDLHHRKEEEILFPFLDQLTGKLPGGPQCTEHMGYYLEWDLVGAVERTASEFSDSTSLIHGGTPVQASALRNPVLGIPISEHHAAHQAIALIKAELSDRNSERLSSLSSLYFKLMDSHIRKEDGCLFCMADGLIGPLEQQELLTRALAIESEIDPERLQKVRLTLRAAPRT